ncbi:tyrosine-type recombinase/integrase [Microbaculum marinum]|uniref:Integrase arm-type DNA-binding domain-containing protein n=1 Tax=Microbaculum marinum TaxID=1764581 RepID=A0AAW9RWD9_9HYPH
MKLTDAKIRNAKPTDRAFKLADGAGLTLHVKPNGSKLWLFRYRVGARERTLSIGPYPEVSLADAREARDRARGEIRDGRDPGDVKKLRKLAGQTAAANTFEAMAREWHTLNCPGWTETHAADVIGSLERDVFPHLGAIPLRDIDAPAVLAVIRAIEARPAIETARRIRQRISAVFVYAISTGRAENDPAATVKGALAPLRKGRQPAITDLDEARQMLRRVDEETAHPVTKLAIRLLALTAVRPGTLATTPWTEWTDLDTEKPVWRVPAARMKMRLANKDDAARDHFVPLPRQAVEAIDALRSLSGRSPYAFPNARFSHKPMSENAMGYLLNRAGYHSKHVPHGWRATFSSVMNERYPADHRVIEAMLAHSPKDKVEAAYNRAAHMARRRELAQAWADLLMEGATPLDAILIAPRR